MPSTLTDIIRLYFRAYEIKDKALIEYLLADDLVFTNPQDGHIDRARYMSHCWPTSEKTAAIHMRKLFVQGNELFVTYDLEHSDGSTIRNTEFIMITNGKIQKIDVYFGPKINESRKNG